MTSWNSGERHWIPITEPDVEAAWSAEIERRLAEIDAGTVELIPWDDVRSELFSESEWRE
jgi:putative addiction module component (TIGR02574 family)